MTKTKTVGEKIKEGCLRKHSQHWKWTGQVLLVTILLGIGSIGWAKSEQPLIPTYLVGVVTEITKKSINVNSNTYKLDPDITISLDTGAKRGLNYLRPGNQIKYQLKHGRIKQVIIIQPN